MNNSNGDALLARLRTGALVTLRGESGATYTGRAERSHGPHERTLGDWQMRQAGGILWPVTAANLIRVQS